MSRFFDKLRNGMARFMYGRNGTDQLNWAILVMYLVLWVIRILVAALDVTVAAMIIDVIMCGPCNPAQTPRPDI